MLLPDIVDRLSALLDIPEFDSVDTALNGLQVSRNRQEVRNVAFAVDASMAGFERAAAARADLLFVHHGLFWGKPAPVTGVLFRRLKYLLERDMALFAAHLPLDVHPELGNNAALAGRLGLQETRPFGQYRGIRIGWMGSLAEEKTLEETAALLFDSPDSCLGVLPFGPPAIRTVGIVSGGLPKAAAEAADLGLDLFVTGDSSHEVYHECLEAGINVIFGGHYQTETWGVKAAKERVDRWKGLTTSLIDVPTGL
jgi:dinuclear metal center YbgI/SA1388 family protein